MKATVETQQVKDNKDQNTLLGVRQSKSAYSKVRTSLHFESKQDALKREKSDKGSC